MSDQKTKNYIRNLVREVLAESNKSINEELSKDDIKAIREIIRSELAFIFKDLWIKRKTWSN